VWEHTASTLKIVLALAFASPSNATISANGTECFDLAIIAEAPRYRWFPVRAEPDEIILRSPVSIRFVVREVLLGTYGPDYIDIIESMHTEFNSDIDHFLLFIRKEGKQKYSLKGLHYQLVEDRSRQLVWPIAAPIDLSEPESDFTPSNYQTLLRPISYRPKDAWWLETPSGMDPPPPEEYLWGRLDKNGTIIASRGIRAVDLVAAAAAERCKPDGAR
jgi:hypothetical protein